MLPCFSNREATRMDANAYKFARVRVHSQQAIQAAMRVQTRATKLPVNPFCILDIQSILC